MRSAGAAIALILFAGLIALNGGLLCLLGMITFGASAEAQIKLLTLVSMGANRQALSLAPLEPLAKSIDDFQKRGGVIWACTPCVQSRGYQQSDLLEGVVITGASVLHEKVKESAALLSF